MILLLLNTVFTAGYVVLIIYYLFLWKKVPRFNVQPGYIPRTKVSVIIPVRNEAGNILHCLNSILLQNYPSELLEIIVVDDYSEDDTIQTIRLAGLTGVQVISAQIENAVRPAGGKKKAIASGIANSTGKLIVTTDADCTCGPEWIRTIAAFYDETGSVFIAAPVKMTPAKNALSVFQILDFLTLQGIGAAAVHHRFHLLSNGANLAYEKKIFEEVRGFEGIESIASGDDLLLMHKVAAIAPDKIGYCLSDAAIVKTKPEPDFSSFLHQRIRWSSKARFYPDKKITGVLMWVFILNVLLLLSFVYVCFETGYFCWWFLIVLSKTIAELVFLIPVSVFFGQLRLAWYFVPAEPFHIIYTILAGFLGQITRYRWKGRNLN